MLPLPIPIAIPIPRFVFRGMGFDWMYHLTTPTALETIVQRVTGRPGVWTECTVRLLATSGFSSPRRLLRDYSVLDFELTADGRGRYTYFFCGEPSGWGLFKNFQAFGGGSPLDHGFGVVRIRVDDLLARYDGPLFYRADDHALVIRGGYEGPAQVEPLPMNAAVRDGPTG
jgi:hypothetical protein